MALARTLVDSTAMPVRAQRDGSHQSGGSGSKNRDVHFYLSCFPEIPLRRPPLRGEYPPCARLSAVRSRVRQNPAFRGGRTVLDLLKLRKSRAARPSFNPRSQSSIRDLQLRAREKWSLGFSPEACQCFPAQKIPRPALYEQTRRSTGWSARDCCATRP